MGKVWGGVHGCVDNLVYIIKGQTTLQHSQNTIQASTAVYLICECTECTRNGVCLASIITKPT